MKAARRRQLPLAGASTGREAFGEIKQVDEPGTTAELDFSVAGQGVVRPQDDARVRLVSLSMTT